MNPIQVCAVLVCSSILSSAAWAQEKPVTVVGDPPVLVLPEPGSKPAPVPEAPPLDAKLYDLRDLLSPARTEKWPWHPANGPNGSAEAMAQLVRRFCDPPLAADAEIACLGKHWLTVLALPEQHAWLEAQLITARATAAAGRLLEVRIERFTMSDELFDKLLRPAVPGWYQSGGGAEPEPSMPGKSQSLAPVVLDSSPDTAAFLAGLRDHDDVAAVTEVLRQAPLATGYAGEVAQTGYVKDFAVEVSDNASVANPIIDVVNEGISIQVSSVPLNRGGYGLAMRTMLGDLQRPIPTFTTTLGVGNPVSIQLPRVTHSRAEAVVAMGEGETVLVALESTSGKRVAVTASVRRAAKK